MTDKIYKYIFRLINQETGLLITMYPDDESVINDLYEHMIYSDVDDCTALKNYIALLIKFCESKEYYEKCSLLLKLNHKISD